jgi:hypothetical protein
VIKNRHRRTNTYARALLKTENGQQLIQRQFYWLVRKSALEGNEISLHDNSYCHVTVDKHNISDMLATTERPFNATIRCRVLETNEGKSSLLGRAG